MVGSRHGTHLLVDRVCEGEDVCSSRVEELGKVLNSVLRLLVDGCATRYRACFDPQMVPVAQRSRNLVHSPVAPLARILRPQQVHLTRGRRLTQ